MGISTPWGIAMTADVQKNQGGDPLLILGGLFIAADVFGLDLWLGGGIAVCVGYALVVLIGVAWPGRAYILTAAVGGTLLTGLGFYLLFPPTEFVQEISNRGAAVFVIWLTAVAGLMQKKAREKREEFEQALNTQNVHIHRLDHEKKQIEESLLEKRRSLERVQEDCRTLSADLLIKENVLAQSQEEKHALEEKLEQEKQKRSEAEAEQARVSAEREEAQAEQARTKEERDRLRDDVWKKEEQLRLVKKNLQQAERDLLAAGTQLEQSDNERLKLERLQADHDKELSRLNDALLQAGRALKDKEDKLVQMEKLWLKLEADLLESGSFLDRLRQERESLQSAHRQQEERISSLEAVKQRIEKEASLREQRLKTVEEDLKRTAAALKKSESHSAQPVEAVWIWEVDAQGTFTYCSDAVQDFLGHAPGDLVGKKFFFDLFDPACREEAKTTAFNVFAKRGKIEGVLFPYVHKEGTRVYLKSQASPIWGEAGAFLGYRGVETQIPAVEAQPQRRETPQPQAGEADLEQRVRDRTRELLRINERLRQEIQESRGAREPSRSYTQELERSNRELRNFAATASHDLQEPLRKVTAFSDRLRKDCSENLGVKGQDYLDRMERAVHRMQGLIEDLLQYSRVSIKGTALFQKIRLSEVVEGTLAMLETLLTQTQGRVQVDPLPELEADRMQMHQLFQNLISNALKFHKPGEPPEVTIRHRPLASGHHEIRVQDNGIGFEPDQLERIFEPFERLHGRSEYEGSGMGLSICRKIVERHGGALTAESRPGLGSTFILTLPQRPGSATGSDEV